MNGFFEMLGVPLGMIMSFIYSLIKDYFLTIFVFTFLIRLLLFPLSLKQQKAAMDRARLAPRLERLQKKYGQDRNKLMMKQQELYERHGVKMTPGCLPMILQMLVLMGVIGVIYTPLTQLAMPKISDPVISVAQQAIVQNVKMDEATAKKEFYNGYYGELNLMMKCDEGTNKDAIIKAFENPSKGMLQTAYGVTLKDDNAVKTQRAAFKKEISKVGSAKDMYDHINAMSNEFDLFGMDSFNLLKKPWTDGENGGFKDINILWLIPLISGVTAFFVSWISLRFTKRSMPQNQPGQGCTNNMMLIYMPAFSAFIGFTVPGAVGIYWIFSNLISMLQTVILNKMYDPGKARMEAEAEMAERRRKKAEDKKRLAMARQREEAEARKAEQALERQREESREMNKKKKKKGSASASKPSEETSEENGSTDAVDTQPAQNTDEQSAE